jgi:hypothetical protein
MRFEVLVRDGFSNIAPALHGREHALSVARVPRIVANDSAAYTSKALAATLNLVRFMTVLLHLDRSQSLPGKKGEFARSALILFREDPANGQK